MIQSLTSLRTKMPAKIPAWGFTLIELAIVLGVAGLLFAGLWRLMSGGNQQLRDQAAASSQTQLISAVKGYLASGQGQSFMAAQAASAKFSLALPTTAPDGVTNANCEAVGSIPAAQNLFCNFLPAGFTSASTNSYGQTYTIQVLKDSSLAGTAPTTYSFMILTSGGTAIPDSSGGRISSSIGGDGGFVYSNNVCGSAPSVQSWACGAYGAWSTLLSAYNLSTPSSGGYIASRTFVSPEQDSGTPWLAKSFINNNTYYNTMITDMYVGPNPNAASQHGGTAANNDIGWINFNTPTGANATGQINMNGGHVNLEGGGITVATGASSVANAITGVTGGITMGGGNITMGTGGLDFGSATAVANGITGVTGGIDMGGGTIADGYISLTTPQPPVGHTGFITLNTGCSIFTTSGCPAAIYITEGDINVVNGEVAANELYATTFIYQASDYRLKTNIEPLPNALQNLMSLKPVSFNFKSSGKPSLGFIAQDVEKVYPQLVSENQGTKFVNYDGLIAPLVQAVQELKEENTQMREQIKIQANHEQKLEQELQRIKKTP